MTMKENIQVNLFGTLYHIDRDAYDLLKEYEDNMRRYFARREGGDEIADDIEHRVAELIEELRQNGTEAITISHVEDIIRRIGRPEDIADTDKAADTAPGADAGAAAPDGAGQSFNRLADDLRDATRSGYRTLRRRKLFRDPRDKMLGGVLSGLTHYFGLKNPLWLRLLMVILFFCSYSTILIAYAILWILIPQAQSAEDFLRMDGRDVTPESLGEQIVNNNRRESTSGQPAPPASGINQLLRFLAKALYFVLIFIGGAMLFVVALVFIAMVFGGIALGIHCLTGPAALFGPAGLITWDDYYLPQNMAPLFWTLIGSSVAAVVITLYAGIAFFLRLRGRVAPMRMWLRLVLIFLFIASIGGIVGSVTAINSRLVTHGYEYLKDAAANDDPWRGLDWADFYELRTGDDTHGLNQTVVFYDLEPGRWRVTLQVAADAPGCAIYALDRGGHLIQAKHLPATPHLNATTLAHLSQLRQADIHLPQPDSLNTTGQLSHTDDTDNNYAILPHESMEFTVPADGFVTLGITTDRSITHATSWEGHNVAFSTDPFKLERVEPEQPADAPREKKH